MVSNLLLWLIGISLPFIDGQPGEDVPRVISDGYCCCGDRVQQQPGMRMSFPTQEVSEPCTFEISMAIHCVYLINYQLNFQPPIPFCMIGGWYLRVPCFCLWPILSGDRSLPIRPHNISTEQTHSCCPGNPKAFRSSMLETRDQISEQNRHLVRHLKNL